MEDDDRAELDAMLGSLSADAARIAGNAMDGVIEQGAAGQAPANTSLDWIVRTAADALAHTSRRHALSANQIAAAVARAVQRGSALHMTAFHDVQLPLALAFGAVGGPERATDIARLASGDESRNSRWASSRKSWDIGGVVMKLDLAHDLVAFFEARRGRLYGFRFHDPIDCKSCAPSLAPAATDQPLGTGDGVTTVFQLIKRYASGAGSWDRAIVKPVDGSVIIAANGAATTAFDMDPATGIVTFHAAPAGGETLTAGFEFDTPVRFDVDRLELSLVGHGAARIARASLVEIAG